MTEQALEYFGVVTGLAYLLLEIRQHKAMWVLGFITSLVYVFVFYDSKIYADMGLNIYYTGISVYGFLQWGRKRKEPIAKSEGENSPSSASISYRHLSLPLLAGISFALCAIFALLWYLLSHFTDSPIPVGDAFTTAVGIVATWMLARRIIEHWIFWVIVNMVSVYLYYIRGLYPTLFLYFCYAVLAAVGYYNWRKNGTVETK